MMIICQTEDIMEKRFWIVTLMFFLAVSTCFLLILSQQVTGVVTPAVASSAKPTITIGNSSEIAPPFKTLTPISTSNSESQAP